MSWLLGLAQTLALAGPGALVPPPRLLPVQAEAAGPSLRLPLPGPATDGERVVLSSLRTPPGLLAAQLVDPQGQQRWQARGPALQLQPVEQRNPPSQQGDMLLPLAALRINAPGRWWLQLDFSRPVDPRAVRFVHTLLARDQLALPALAQAPRVGVSWPFSVLAMRDGLPLKVEEGLAVELLGPDGERLELAAARVGARNAQGVLISQVPGEHISLVHFAKPGCYTRVARWRPAGAGSVLEVRASVEVLP